MAIVVNEFTSYDAKGIREELSDIIYNISPEDTPLMSNIGRGSVDNTLYEFQQDALAAVDTANAQLEGDDSPAMQAVTPTVRIGNYTQISRKTVSISGTLEAVKKAGRKSELSYQLAMRSAELKRDMEGICFLNQAAVGGSTTVARKTAGLGAWIKTNVDKGTGGVNPVYTTLPNDVRTDGTQRAVTETILKNAIALAWTAGASPTMVLVGPKNKQTISGFAGIATKTITQTTAKKAIIIAAADIYVSDFGTLYIQPSRFQRERDGWIIDTEYASLVYLRKFFTKTLAVTGDNEKRMLLVEWSLKVHHEQAHALMADLTD